MKNLYLGHRSGDIMLRPLYELATHQGRDEWHKRQGFDLSYIASFCPSLFEQHTTIRMNGKEITLAPGQLVRVKSIVFDVEEVR